MNSDLVMYATAAGPNTVITPVAGESFVITGTLAAWLEVVNV